MHSLILDIGKEKWKAAGGLRNQNGQEREFVKGRLGVCANGGKECKDEDGSGDGDGDSDCDDGFESDDGVVGRSSSILGRLPLSKQTLSNYLKPDQPSLRCAINRSRCSIKAKAWRPCRHL